MSDLQSTVLAELARELVAHAPARWRRTDFVCAVVGERVFARVGYGTETTEVATVPTPASIPGIARRLKHAMYVRGRGSWLTMRCTVSPDGSIDTDFDYLGRPRVRDDSMFRYLHEDLVAYPRDIVPEWIKTEVNVHLPFPDDAEFGAGHHSTIAVEVGPNDLYWPTLEREQAARLALGFVPEEPDLTYFRIVRGYTSEYRPVATLLELNSDRVEYRRVEKFPNGCVDCATITSEGQYALPYDDECDAWPSTSELLREDSVLGVEEITALEFQTEWIAVEGDEDY